nr:hypothetical protein [uncultured Flavobacterium sp.]
MRQFATIIMLFILQNHFAQNHIKYTKDSDTTLINYRNKVEDKFDIQHITDLQESYVFRSWNTNSLLEIRKDSTNQLTGTITYIADESSKENSSIYTKTFNLSYKEVAELYKVINTSRIDTIADDYLIAGWPRGFDGYLYTYETKNDSVYSRKSYRCAGNYQLLPEAVAVERFNKKLYDCLTKDYFKIFEDEMPFLSWHYPGTALHVSKILPKEQFLNYKTIQRKNGPYINKTKHYKLVYNEYASDGPKNDTITTIIHNWRGYKFVTTINYFPRIELRNHCILKNKDTIANTGIFNNKVSKLLNKINKSLEKQFIKIKQTDAKEASPCLEGMTFIPFEMDKLEMEINTEKEFTFIAQNNVGMACLPVMYYSITIAYSKIKKYLIDTLTKVSD